MAASGRSRVGGCDVTCIRSIARIFFTMCSRNLRCMKCAGLHKSKDCPKPSRDTQPKCLHCNGAHTSNFTDCPKNPFNRKPFPAAPENAWSDPAVLAKIKAPSYSYC
ncbi:hypothetical protein AVEN_65922-1 [Araneus ventricosus]|uniref:Nucleic-acid-binding protein from transposon X-element n=1 Tax=Araneus ventricosus TaxID=182803 RepID=A0A4Y2RBE6_ARAVE|nr:hypothetical protein AVEN_65922-1 [Araneus ventricosus]